MADNFNFFSIASDILNPTMAKGSKGIELGDAFSGINARGDALQNWCWYCVPPAIYNTDAIDLDNLTISSLAAPLVWLPWYYVQSATLPDRSIQTRTTQRNGHAMNFPHTYSVGDLTLTLFLDSKNVARQWLRSWQHLVLSVDNPRNPSNQGRWGLPYQYKRDISFVVHSVQKKRVLHYKYIGCWPKDTSGLELTSGESGALTCDVTFSVEDVRVSVGNEEMFESFWIPNDLVDGGSEPPLPPIPDPPRPPPPPPPSYPTNPPPPLPPPSPPPPAPPPPGPPPPPPPGPPGPPPPSSDYWAYVDGACRLNPTVVGGTPKYGTLADCQSAHPAGATPTLNPSIRYIDGNVGLSIVPTAPYTTTGFTGAVTYSWNLSPDSGLTINPTTGVISGTPTAVMSGISQTVTVTATSGSQAANASVMVSVAVAPPGPTPPTPTPPPSSSTIATPTITYPIEGATGIPTNVKVTSSAFSSTNGDTHNSSGWQIATDAAFTSIVSQELLAPGTTLWDPPGLQTNTKYYVRVKYYGNSGAVSAFSPAVSFTTSGTSSTYITPATQAIYGTSGTPITPTTPFTAVGFTGTITYTWDLSPASGLTINSSTGVISGTPAANVGNSQYAITVTATGSPSGVATALVNVYFNTGLVNNNPTTTLPFTFGNGIVGDTYSVGLAGTYFSDPDGDTLTFTATGLPPGMTISSDGVISGSPTTAGSYTVVVTANDGKGGSVTGNIYWGVD